ncbi:MAG: tail fiber protein [Bacteroidota bacterium]
MNGYTGEIRLFAGNFAPRNWAFCDGTLMPVSQYTALFSILGTTYGGDGRTTFGLPNLQGRVAIHPGTGPGLSTYRAGQVGGSETNTISENQMPAHSHTGSGTYTPKATDEDGTTHEPAGAYFAKTQGTGAGDTIFNKNADANTFMSTQNFSVNLDNTGGSESVENRQPVLALRYIVCLEGSYPSRP